MQVAQNGIQIMGGKKKVDQTTGAQSKKKSAATKSQLVFPSFQTFGSYETVKTTQ